MKQRIIFATGNKNKIREIHEILGDLGWEILSMKEAGIDLDIVEDGTTFDYLNKEPGIYSARYAGEDTSYDIKNQMLLDRLQGVPREKRTARFVCAIAAVVPGHEPIVVRGTIEGYIGDKPAGENGFGYDPIFYVPDLNCSTAELSPEEKNARSHRGNALRAMREELKQYRSDVR